MVYGAYLQVAELEVPEGLLHVGRRRIVSEELLA